MSDTKQMGQHETRGRAAQNCSDALRGVDGICGRVRKRWSKVTRNKSGAKIIDRLASLFQTEPKTLSIKILQPFLRMMKGFKLTMLESFRTVLRQQFAPPLFDKLLSAKTDCLG